MTDTSFNVYSIYKSDRFKDLIMTESFFVPQNNIGTATTGVVTSDVAVGRRSYSVGYSKKVKNTAPADEIKGGAGGFMGILVPSLREESCIDYSKEDTVSLAISDISSSIVTVTDAEDFSDPTVTSTSIVPTIGEVK